MAKHKLLKEYDALRVAGKIKRYSPDVEKSLSRIYKESLDFLQVAKKIDLISKVDNKKILLFKLRRIFPGPLIPISIIQIFRNGKNSRFV